MGFEINQEVKYNKQKFVISAFINNDGKLFKEIGNNEWVLLYRDCNQIKVHIENISFHKKHVSSNIDDDISTDEILGKLNL